MVRELGQDRKLSPLTIMSRALLDDRSDWRSSSRSTSSSHCVHLRDTAVRLSARGLLLGDPRPVRPVLTEIEIPATV